MMAMASKVMATTTMTKAKPTMTTIKAMATKEVAAEVKATTTTGMLLLHVCVQGCQLTCL